MNINNAFPSTYLKAADLAGQRVNVTISKAVLEDIGKGEMKLVLHFLGKDKGIILNKTNAFIIGESFGSETDAWIGQSIVLFSHMVSFNGQMVPGLAVMCSAPNIPSQPQQAPVQQSAGHQAQPGDGLQAIADQVAVAESEKQKQDQAAQAFADDDIPFNKIDGRYV